MVIFEVFGPIRGRFVRRDGVVTAGALDSTTWLA